MGEHRDPLLGQRRICGLRKTCIPFGVPRIHPMMEIVGGEENMKRCVVGVQGQLRQQKWQMHDDSRQQNEA